MQLKKNIYKRIKRNTNFAKIMEGKSMTLPYNFPIANIRFKNIFKRNNREV